MRAAATNADSIGFVVHSLRVPSPLYPGGFLYVDCLAMERFVELMSDASREPALPNDFGRSAMPPANFGLYSERRRD
jgi:hypothetical protein